MSFLPMLLLWAASTAVTALIAYYVIKKAVGDALWEFWQTLPHDD